MRLRLFVQIHLVLLYSVEEDILESYVSVDLQPGVRSEPRVIELLSRDIIDKGSDWWRGEGADRFTAL